MAVTTLLFDFDGTIADSSRGIIASLRYALERNGVGDGVTDEKIKYSIGPPLLPLIERVLGGKADEKMTKAIAVSYREHYTSKGLFMATLYEGIAPALESLSEMYNLYIVSSKPKEFIEKLLPVLCIEGLFKNVYGPGTELTPLKKAELIRLLLDEKKAKPDECVMIGDKAEDAIAAKTNGIKTAGVLYGFGSKEELETAGVFCFVEKPQDLVGLEYDFL